MLDAEEYSSLVTSRGLLNIRPHVEKDKDAHIVYFSPGVASAGI